MQAISATPEEVRKVFSGRYIILSFQRPYSWKDEHCEKLWDDIINSQILFYQKHSVQLR